MAKVIPIEEIVIPSNRRRFKPQNAQEIANSIKAVGLLQPIGLRPDKTLVFGLHRIEAYKLLGLRWIEYRTIEADDIDVQIAEIDENNARSALDGLEWSQYLKRRKQLWEQKNPSTSHGGDRKTEASVSSRQNGDLKRFTADTAKKTGKSERTIQRDVAVAEAIPEDVQDAIAAVEPSKSELQALAKLPEQEQRKAAKQVESGKVKRLKEALPKREKPARKNGAEVGEGLKREVLKDLGRVKRGLDSLRIYSRVKSAVEAIHQAIKDA